MFPVLKTRKVPLTVGIKATGNYPAKRVMPVSYVPIWNRLCGGFRGRNGLIYMPSIWNQIRQSRAIIVVAEHFKNWVEWAKANQLGSAF